MAGRGATLGDDDNRWTLTGRFDRRSSAHQVLGRQDPVVHRVEPCHEVAARHVVSRGEEAVKLSVQGVARDVLHARDEVGTSNPPRLLAHLRLMFYDSGAICQERALARSKRRLVAGASRDIKQPAIH